MLTHTHTDSLTHTQVHYTHSPKPDSYKLSILFFQKEETTDEDLQVVQSCCPHHWNPVECTHQPLMPGSETSPNT